MSFVTAFTGNLKLLKYIIIFREGIDLPWINGALFLGSGEGREILHSTSNFIQNPCVAYHFCYSLYENYCSSHLLFSPIQVPNASATAASVSSDLYGAAVLDACEQLKARMEPIASKNNFSSFAEVLLLSWILNNLFYFELMLFHFYSGLLPCLSLRICWWLMRGQGW